MKPKLKTKATSGATKSKQSQQTTPKKPQPSAPDAEESGTPVPDEKVVNELIAELNMLNAKTESTEKDVINQRVEIGCILLRLKDEVGHGRFMPEFKKWQEGRRINFSLKTGQRAMRYAQLAEEGKFDSVSNLADAERLYKDWVAGKDREKKEAEAVTDEADPGSDVMPVVKLKKSQITRKARDYAMPVLKEADGYDLTCGRDLLEEIIEILTEKLEEITTQIEQCN